MVVLWNRIVARGGAGGLQGSSEPEIELGCGTGCLFVRLASTKGSKAIERCGGRGVGEPQLMLDRGTSVIFVMSRVVLRDAGVHLAAIAMALKLAGGGALKEVVRTAAGLLMLLALLQPLAGLHVLSWNWQGSVSQSDIDEMQARNMQTTMSTVAASIAKAVQQRAEEAGIPCTVNVEMANDADGLLQVDKVTVYYDSTAANRLSELQSLLTKECGVPAERQELIAR